MADALDRSPGAEALKLLDGTVPGYFERHDIGQGGPVSSPAGSQPRRSVSRMSAPVAAGNALRRQRIIGRSAFGASGGGAGDGRPAPGQVTEVTYYSVKIICSREGMASRLAANLTALDYAALVLKGSALQLAIPGGACYGKLSADVCRPAS